MKKVSCIIIAYKSSRFHQALLKSLYQQTQKPFEIIFIDNEGSLETQNFCKKNKLVYFSTGNIGYGQACNYGAKNAKGDYLLFLNPDLILQDNLLEKLAKSYTHSTGLVSCFVKTYDGKTITNDFGKVDNLGRPIRCSKNDNQLVNGCTVFCSKNIFSTLGGFSKNFFMYGEDTDLALKTLKLNKTNKVIDTTSVWHYGGGSQENKYQKIPHVLKSIFLIYIKHKLK